MIFLEGPILPVRKNPEFIWYQGLPSAISEASENRFEAESGIIPPALSINIYPYLCRLSRHFGSKHKTGSVDLLFASVT
jgi:hypothetical protein